ncbi:unnamed protein product [Closterium sp. NIES-53]
MSSASGKANKLSNKSGRNRGLKQRVSDNSGQKARDSRTISTKGVRLRVRTIRKRGRRRRGQRDTLWSSRRTQCHRYGRGRAAPRETAEIEPVPSAPGSPVPAAPPAAPARAPPPAAPASPVAPGAPPAPIAPAAPPAAPAPAAPLAAPVAPPEPPAAPAPAATRQRREYHSRSRCGERGSRHDGTPRAPPNSAPPGSAPPVPAPPVSAPLAAPESTATSTGSAGSTWDTPEGAGPWGGRGSTRGVPGARKSGGGWGEAVR